MAENHDKYGRDHVSHVQSYVCVNKATGEYYSGTADDPNRVASGTFIGGIHEHRADVPHFPPLPEPVHDHRHAFNQPGDHRTQRATAIMHKHTDMRIHNDNLRARCMDIITSGKFSDQDRDIALIALEALTKCL